MYAYTFSILGSEETDRCMIKWSLWRCSSSSSLNLQFLRIHHCHACTRTYASTYIWTEFLVFMIYKHYIWQISASLDHNISFPVPSMHEPSIQNAYIWDISHFNTSRSSRIYHIYQTADAAVLLHMHVYNIIVLRN